LGVAVHDQRCDVVVMDLDGAVVTTVEGEIDMHTAVFLDEALDRLPAGTHARLDLGHVRFIDSGGLRVLISHATRLRQSGGSLDLSETSRFVERVAQIAAVSDLLHMAGR
jgi:anti-anti-sigma factor